MGLILFVYHFQICILSWYFLWRFSGFLRVQKRFFFQKLEDAKVLGPETLVVSLLGRVLAGALFVVVMVSENWMPCVSWIFYEVSNLRRFFGKEYYTMTLMMRQVDFPVATEKGRDFVAEFFVACCLVSRSYFTSWYIEGVIDSFEKESVDWRSWGVFYRILLSVVASLYSLFAAASKIRHNIFVVYPLTVRKRNNFLVISS